MGVQQEGEGIHPSKDSRPTTKSAKTAKNRTWERHSLHPPGNRARSLNRLSLSAFFAFSVVTPFRLGSWENAVSFE
jgi:hypothetical protein